MHGIACLITLQDAPKQHARRTCAAQVYGEPDGAQLDCARLGHAAGKARMTGFSG